MTVARTIRTLAAGGALALIGYGLWASDGISDGRWLAILGVAWLLLVVASWLRLPKSVPPLNRTVIRTAVALATVFAVLSVQLVRIQVIHGETTVERTAVDPESGEIIGNPRLADADRSIDRGRIFDRNGEIIADTENDDGVATRVYPDPATAYVAGYYSPLLYGMAGLEATYDDELSGEAGNSPIARTLNDLLHRPQEGLDLQLTLDADLQRTAHELLGNRPGAVVLVDVKTGAVLALASNPNYDPNELFTSSAAERADATEYWESLIDDPETPLVLRATGGLFAPGSTFKTVTAAAAIDAGLAKPDDVYQDDGSLEVDGHVITEFNRPDDSIDEWTLADGLAWSLNVVFAQVGLQLGAERLEEYAERFGFGERIPFDLPIPASQIASSDEFLSSLPALADTAFGQGELLVTPMQMALIAAAIANGGAMMHPYLVDRITTQDGDTRDQTEPEEWQRPISSAAAQQVADMMINAVENGYAGGAAIDGLVVGGKTGTAETGEDEEPHSWFIGFVGDPEPRYAIAVLLEHGGAGQNEALTVGREMLAVVMGRPQ